MHEDFIGALKEALRERLAADWSAYKDGLSELMEDFLENSRSDLERWTGLLATGALNPEEYEWLLKGKRHLGEMDMLQRIGLSLAQIDRFRAAIIETIVGTAIRTVA